MPTTPTGLPAWTRTADHQQYGGHVNKRNYLDRGAIDHTTDLAAEALCRMAADLEAISRTSPFCSVTFRCMDAFTDSGTPIAVPEAPRVETAFMMIGTRVVSYSGARPPIPFPAATRNGNGDVTFTFESSYTDDYGVVGNFTPRHAVASLHGSAPGSASVVIAGNTVRVVAWNAAAPISDARMTLQVS